MARKGYKESTFTYNGKRYYVYGKTAKELLEKEVAKRKELEEGEKNISNPTLDDYYESLKQRRSREVRESTIRSQASQYKTISDAKMVNGNTFGSMRIADIRRKHIEDARETLFKEGKTPQNLNNCFAHLNHIFNCALIDEIIEKNPCKALKPMKREDKPIGETKHRALSEDETIRFFRAAEERKSYYRNLFLIMIKTGMRIGEVTALYPTDIDRKNGFIHVRRTIMRDSNGSYKVGEDAKTKSGQRDIPLTDETYEIIKAQRVWNKMLFGDKADGLIFKSAEGKILREYGANREIARICNAAGIEKFTCHAFRNTYATRFIEQRPQDYKILSEILGHKDISITLNLYTHVMNENKVKAFNFVSIKTS